MKEETIGNKQITAQKTTATNDEVAV